MSDLSSSARFIAGMMAPHRAVSMAIGAVVVAGLLAGLVSATPAETPALRWYRGNTHTHTINSDGDASPDVVVRWFREHGYQFVVVTDHEQLTAVEPLNRQFGAPDRFLVIGGEELTQEIEDSSHPDRVRQLHINAINLATTVHAIGRKCCDDLARVAPPGTTVAQALSADLSAVRSAGAVAQLNHPNYRWSIRFEDLHGLPENTLLEIWNAGPEHNNLGGIDAAGHMTPSPEKLWDMLLTGGKRVWGVASDDSHQYHDFENPRAARPGLAWIVVRAPELSAAAISSALAAGNFYASNGVELDEITADAREVQIRIHDDAASKPTGDAKPDTRYMTRFVGAEGRVLAEVGGHVARYTVRGNEQYVRAVITDSNGRQAWTQPRFLSRSRDTPDERR